MKRVLPIALCIGAMLLATAAIAGENDNLDVRFAAHVKPYPTGRGVPTAPCPPGYDPNTYPTPLPCSQYTVVTGLSGPYPTKGPWIYVVAGQGGSVGIKGVSFGIDYKVGDGPYCDTVLNPNCNIVADPGIGQQHLSSQANYVLCPDGLPFPNAGPNGTFPAPGGGLRITWGTCQNTVIDPDGVHAVVAKFYVYAYSNDTFEITPNNNLVSGAELDVTNCGGQTTKLLFNTAPSLRPLLMGKVQFGTGRDGLLGYTPCGVVNTEPSTWGKLKTLFEE